MGRRKVKLSITTAAHWAREYVANGRTEDEVIGFVREAGYGRISEQRMRRAFRRQQALG